MTKNEKERLYNKLNDLLDMMYEGEAKTYLKDIINQIYHDQLLKTYMYYMYEKIITKR